MARILQPTRNRIKVLVNGSLEAGDTSITLLSGGSTLPDTTTEGAFRLVLFNGSTVTDPSNDPYCEDVVVTDRAGDVLTVEPLQFDHNDLGAQYVLYLTWDKLDIDTVDDFLRDMNREVNSVTYDSDGFVTVITTPYRVYTLSWGIQGLSKVTTNDTVPKVLTLSYNQYNGIKSITLS